MTEKMYLVRLKAPSNALHHVRAVDARLYGDGDHLVFVDSQGRLAAMFLTELVESWNEIVS